MSYCRFSSDDFQCDVYAYESVTGEYVIHVAARRVVFCEPLPPELPFPRENDPEGLQCWLDRHSAVMDIVGRSPREDIELPFSGQTLAYETPQEAAEALQKLAKIGYRVPEYTIEVLLNEVQNEPPGY